MSDIIQLFENMLERSYWQRIFMVVVGSFLVYYALMSGQNRLANFG